MAIANMQVSTLETLLVKADANTTKVVFMLNCANTDTVTRTLKLYAYPSGGSLSNASMLVPPIEIPGNEVFVYNERLVLQNGDRVVAVADIANKITITSSSLVL